MPASPERFVAPRRVNRDRDDFCARPVQLGLLIRQPNQLAAAVRSPVPAVHDQREGTRRLSEAEHVGHRATLQLARTGDQIEAGAPDPHAVRIAPLVEPGAGSRDRRGWRRSAGLGTVRAVTSRHGGRSS